MTTGISPAKFILFGEHAVVYGEPALAVSVQLSMKVSAETSEGESTVDGRKMSRRPHSYLMEAMDRVWEGGPVSFKVESGVPRASGLGSSAAVTIATLAALRGLSGEDLVEEELAKDGFEVEYSVQGKASPTDTSTCTHGNAIMLAKEEMKDLLWKVEKGEKSWYIHHVDIPKATFVVGSTGIRGKTGRMVEKVRRYYEKSGLARETVEDIGQISLEGAEALAKGDLVRVGELMTKNHQRLVSLGVNHARLEALVQAVLPHSYGAKLTGAGGGGSIVALTDRPDQAAEAISQAGGTPIIVNPARRGAHILHE